MNVILNIGLAVNATPSIAAHVALEIVKANGFLVRSHKVLQSDTEPTLVVEADWRFDAGLPFWVVGQAVHQTAVDLHQDCIAGYLPKMHFGKLIGPRAAAWGPFDPALFLMPDGTRLSDRNPAAKAA